MKINITLIIVLLFSLFVYSSNAQEINVAKTNKNADLEKNKKIVMRVFQEIVNERNLSVIDKLYIPEIIDHSAFEGQAPGTEGIKNVVKDFFKTLPDFKVTVEDIIVVRHPKRNPAHPLFC